MTNRSDPKHNDTTYVESVVDRALPIIKASISPKHYNLEDNQLKQKVMDFINTPVSQLVPKAQRDKNAQELLDAARIDLESAKVLYKKRIYSSSTYHLQQAVEKATKTYGLAFNLVTEKDFTGKIGHKTPKVFTLGIKNDGIQTFLPLIKLLNPGIKTDITALEKIIETKDMELALTSKEQIMQIIKLSHNLRTSFEGIDIAGFLDQTQNLFATQLNEEERAITEPMITNIRNKFKMSLVASFATLFLLGAITYPHAENRYPITRVLPPKEYKEGLGIVDTTPELILLIERTITDLDECLRNRGKSGDASTADLTQNNFA